MPMPHPKTKQLPPEDAFKGLVGEHAVSGILNLLTFSYEEMVVFHSVGISETVDGETDHIVIYKNKLFIVETKNYSSYTSIFVNQEGRLNGKKRDLVVSVNDNGILKKVSYYKTMFPEMDIEAILVMTRPQTRTGSSFKGYSIATIKTLIDTLQNKFETATPVHVSVTNTLVKCFGNLCIRNESYN